MEIRNRNNPGAAPFYIMRIRTFFLVVPPSFNHSLNPLFLKQKASSSFLPSTFARPPYLLPGFQWVSFTHTIRSYLGLLHSYITQLISIQWFNGSMQMPSNLPRNSSLGFSFFHKTSFLSRSFSPRSKLVDATACTRTGVFWIRLSSLLSCMQNRKIVGLLPLGISSARGTQPCVDF